MMSMMVLRWCWGDVVVILLCGYWGEVTARCCPENICQVEGRESTNKRPGQSCQLFMGSNLQCAGPACRSSPQTGADWQTGRLLCLDVSILQPPLATCWHLASQATRPDVLPRTLSCSSLYSDTLRIQSCLTRKAACFSVRSIFLHNSLLWLSSLF